MSLLIVLSGCKGPAEPASAAPAPSAPPSAPAPPAEPPAPEATSALAPRPMPAPGDEALISAAELSGQLDRVLVIDVRPRQAFDEGHVAGATHMKLHELKVSGAVRARESVVVSTGFGPVGLSEVVSDLRERGARLRVLDGGFAAWCGGAPPVKGRCDGADTIEPRDLEASLSCPDRPVLVVATSPNEARRARQLLPSATVAESMAAVPAAARKALGETGRYLAVLGVDAGVRAALKDAGAHVFEVAGGLDGYGAFRDARHAMLNRKIIVSQGQRRTATGRPSADVVRGEKGCGCM